MSRHFSDTPTRLFAVVSLLAAVWVLAYWLYEPADPGVTLGVRPGDSTRTAGSPIGPLEPRQRPAATRLTPAAAVEAQPTEPADTPSADPNPAAANSPGNASPNNLGVIPPRFREYTVRREDTGWESISRHVYGTEKHWQAIARANPFVSPHKLIPGRTVLRIPEDPTNVHGKPAPTAGQPPPGAAPPAAPAPAFLEYTITSDDTLSSIARRFYGKESLWTRIHNANRDTIPNPNLLKPGTVIRIPQPTNE